MHTRFFPIFLLFQLVILTTKGQGWAPFPLHQKAYFLLNGPLYTPGNEVFVNRFNPPIPINGDSVFSKNGVKPLLRVGHADRSSDFLGYSLTKTNFGYQLSHHNLKTIAIPFDPLLPEYTYDSLLIDTLLFTFARHPKLGQVGLHVQSDTLNYTGTVTALADTMLEGVADSVARITIYYPANAFLHNKVLTLSKKQGWLQGVYLVNGKAGIERLFSTETISKADFTVQARKKLSPGDRIDVLESRQSGFAQGLDGFTLFNSETIYEVLDTGAAGVQVHRTQHEAIDPAQEFMVYHSWSDVVYWTDTLNNPNHALNTTPMLGTYNPWDTVFNTYGYPVRAYLTPYMHKRWERGILHAGGESFTYPNMGGLVPWFHCLPLVYSPFRFFDFSDDYSASWMKQVAYYKLGTEQFGAKLTITQTQPGLKPSEVLAYPNPTTGKVWIGQLDFPIERVECFGSNGAVHWLTWESKGMVDMRHLEAGLYQLRIFLQNGEIKKTKVVVQ